MVGDPGLGNTVSTKLSETAVIVLISYYFDYKIETYATNAGNNNVSY